MRVIHYSRDRSDRAEGPRRPGCPHARGMTAVGGARSARALAGLRRRYVVMICIAGAVIIPAIIIVAPDALRLNHAMLTFHEPFFARTE